MKPAEQVLGETSIKGYWRVFGGPVSILRSTYFWISFLLTVFLPSLHQAQDQEHNLVWCQLTLSIIPSLLGFATGGMAIMLAFSNGAYLRAIQQDGKDDSYLRKVMATFFHFALVCTIALILAYIGRFYNIKYLSIAGVFFSLYGILLIMSIFSRLWHTARIFNAVTAKSTP